MCPKAILFDFYFTLLYLVLCRVAAVKSLPVRHHRAGYILFPLGSLIPSVFFFFFFFLLLLLFFVVFFSFENRIPLKRALGDACSLANYSVDYEETQLNRVSDFRNFYVFFFSKGNLFYFHIRRLFCRCSSSLPLMTREDYASKLWHFLCIFT